MTLQSKAYLCTLLAVLFWSTSASAFKFALQSVSTQNLLLYTTALSFLVLMGILVLQGKMDHLRRLPRKSLVRYLLLGVLNPCLYYMILFKAYALLPGQMAMSLNYAWPLVLTLLSAPLLKQRLTVGQLGAVLMSFIGAVTIATQGKMIQGGGADHFGILLAALSTFIWALFWLFNAQDGHDPVVKLCVCFASGFICTLLFSLFLGHPVWPSPSSWIPIGYIALFEMSLTFILWLNALQYSSSAAQVGNLMYLTPFLSLLCLHVVIGEQIYQATFWGLAIIVASIFIQAYIKKYPPKRMNHFVGRNNTKFGRSG